VTFLRFFFLFPFLLINTVFSQTPKDPVLETNVNQWLKNSNGLRFQENKGQMADIQGNTVNELLFKVTTPGTDLYVTTSGLSYVFTKKEVNELSYCRADMELVDATIKKENIIKTYESRDRTDYYLSQCPNGIRDVHSYGKITIQNIYPGIDWVLYSLKVGKLGSQKRNEEGLKYDFVVHPGADPSLIKLRYKWTDKPELQNDGSVKISSPVGEITEGIPVSYDSDKKHTISTHYSLGDNEIGFNVENYDQNITLIIDPDLKWATYYGGNNYEQSHSISSDGTNVWVTGNITSVNFPTQNPAGNYFQGSLAGTQDAFILQFNTSGVRKWATYYGGSGADFGNSIYSDGTNVWVTGETSSSDFPTLKSGGAYFQGSLAGGSNAFILQFSTSGAPKLATYYGGSQSDCGNSIHSDKTNVWITGRTTSSDFPRLDPGGGTFFQGTLTPGSTNPFIVKITTSGVLQWSTFFGGSTGLDVGYSINSDGSNVWLTGLTSSSDFPIQNSAGAYNQSILRSLGGNVFISQFNTNGILKWSTFYGGSGGAYFYDDVGYSISSDGTNVWVTGKTSSTDFPTLNPGNGAYYQSAQGGAVYYNAFILQFSTSGIRKWATYYGGSGNSPGGDIGNSITSDGTNIWVCGATCSTDFPTFKPGCPSWFQGAFGGNKQDMFILQFNTSGIRKWATFYGNDNYKSNTGYDYRDVTAVSSDGTNLWVSGDAVLNGMPTQDAGGGDYYLPTLAGNENIFIGKFCISCSQLNISLSPPSTICPGSSTTLAAKGGTLNYTWKPATGLSATTGVSVIASPLSTITYTVIGVSGTGCMDSSMVTVTVLPAITIDPIQIVPASCGQNNGSAVANATGGSGMPLIYNWNNGTPGPTNNGLSVGIYTVTVTDNNNCAQTSTANITNTGGPAVSTITSTNITCKGGNNGSATVTMSNGTTDYTYSWNNGSNTINSSLNNTITDLTANTYTVTITDFSGCQAVSTIKVTEPSAISYTLTPTDATCGLSNGSATATASGGNPGYLYSWSNGANIQTINNLAGNTYSVTITDATGCTITSILTIQNDTPAVSIVTTKNTCTGNTDGSIVVSATGTGTLSYTWNNGILGLKDSNLTAGVYTVTVMDGNHCTTTTSANISFFPDPIVNAGQTETITQGQSIQLTASGGIRYSWKPPTFLNNDTIYNPLADPKQTTTYRVLITDENNCSVMDSVLLIVLSCEVAEFFMPTAFSPNGDGENDILYLRGPDCITQMQLQLYNRWGELVFETTNLSKGWDGKFHGKTMESGVFTYYLNATLSNAQKISRKGNVTLLR